MGCVCVKTRLPPWKTFIVALVKSTSVIVAVHLLFGQPAAFALVGCGGGNVVTLKVAFPFLGSMPVCRTFLRSALSWVIDPHRIVTDHLSTV